MPLGHHSNYELALSVVCGALVDSFVYRVRRMSANFKFVKPHVGIDKEEDY